MRSIGPAPGSAPENIERGVCVEARPSARAYFSAHFIGTFCAHKAPAGYPRSGPPRKRIQGVPTGSLAANLLIDRVSLHPLSADHRLEKTTLIAAAGTEGPMRDRLR
jgi:hypothetical protein